MIVDILQVERDWVFCQWRLVVQLSCSLDLVSFQRAFSCVCTAFFALEHNVSKSGRRLNREIIVELDLER